MNEAVRNLYGGILAPPQKGVPLRSGFKEIRLEAGSWVVYLCVGHGKIREGTFKTLDEATIELYLSRVHTLDKAGGYAIQEENELIVAGFTGSLTNIVGLPLDEMKQILTRAGLIR